jgi:predicted dehydrogenase
MGYTAGIVGLGVGRQHGTAYRHTDGIEVGAIADRDPDTLAEFGEQWGVAPEHRYTDHRALLDAEDLDAVSVATPTYCHRDHVLDAVETGNPGVVWCEKPVACSVADAEAMVAACDRQETELVVNHFRRWAPALDTLRRLVREERALGEVQSVTARWPAELLRNGTHCVDMVLHVLDGSPEHVSGYATGETEQESIFGATVDVADSGAGGHILMDDGTFVTVDATVPRRLPPGDDDGVVSPHDAWLHLLGTGGRMRLDAYWTAEGEWRYWALEDGDHVERSLPGIEEGWTVSTERAFRNAAADIVELLDGTGENRCPGTEAVDALEVIVAVFVSHHTGSRVDLPLADPLREVTVTSW